MSGPNWKLEDNLQTITVTFPTDPPTALKLDATGVDELLANLGSFRALMKPEHTYDDPRRKKHERTIIGPRWATETEMLNGEPLLHIRDPRYGILTYLIPKADAEKLGQSLLAFAAAPRPIPPSGKPS